MDIHMRVTLPDAKRNELLWDVDVEFKRVEKRRRAIEKADSCVDVSEFFRNGSAEPVVEFGVDGSFHCPGPNSSLYEKDTMHFWFSMSFG